MLGHRSEQAGEARLPGPLLLKLCLMRLVAFELQFLHARLVIAQLYLTLWRLHGL